MRNTLTKIILIIVVINICCSCKKFIEVNPPNDRIVTSTLFADDGTATSAILGLYARMVSTSPPFSNGGITIYCGLSSDELTFTGTTSNVMEFSNNKISTNNSIVYTNFWRNAYEDIYQANVCIAGLESSKSLTPSVKKQLAGEAYFMRAFCYWNLSNVFGDVPLITSTAYQDNAFVSRQPVSNVQEKVISDLQTATQLLSKSYPTAGRVRVNYYSALALLSRVYLYQNKWQNVETISTEIINSGVYKLESDVNAVFKAPSSEAILQLSSDVGSFNTVEGNRFIPSSTSVKPQYILSTGLFNAFENGDLRKTNWVGTNTISGVPYHYPYKYKVSLNAVKTENYVVLRLAEIYLNRAEARVGVTNLQGALDDLNLIRNRASLPSFSMTTAPLLLDAIQREKRIEYFAEWGMRWFDLRRTGKIDGVLSAVKSNWSSTAALFPIPLSEISVNNNLIQNPGY